MDARIVDVDVLVMPTTPMVAPTIEEVAAQDEFARKNAMLLRNTVIWNFFDFCAISLPFRARAACRPVSCWLRATDRTSVCSALQRRSSDYWRHRRDLLFRLLPAMKSGIMQSMA